MTASQVDPTIAEQNCSSPSHATRQRILSHRRLAAYIGMLSAQRSISVAPWPHPIISAPAAFIAIGSLWGFIIGLSVGGGVGALYLLIGAIWGAPVGAIVGLVVGVPASISLAVVLLVRDRRVNDVKQLARRVAGGLAALIELLAFAGCLAIATVVAIGADSASSDLTAVLLGLAAIGALVVILAAAAWLLRFAARHLVRTWARAWGQLVIR